MSERSRAESIAWAAGVFEGEGCITVTNRRLALRVTNTDRELVDRFIDVVDVGEVYGPYDHSRQRDGYRRKPVYHWAAYGVDALEALELLSPWLGQRRLARAHELTGLTFPCGMGSLGQGDLSRLEFLDGGGER